MQHAERNLNAIDLFNQYNKVLASIAVWLLVFVLFGILGKTIVFFIEGDANTTTGAGIQTIQPNAPTRSSPTVIDAPKTSLNLELQGVFNNEEPSLSSAIVAQKGKSGELFNIGDSLPGNAILNAVFEDHILLKRGTRIEKLSFSNTPLLRPVSNTPPLSRSNSRSRTQSTNASRIQHARDRIAKRAEDISRNRTSSRGSELRKNLSAYRERLESDPQSVLDELGVIPISDAEAKGYRIESQVSQTLLRQVGLKQGDVILSVNGRPVGNIDNDKSLLNQAMTSKRVRVEVQRDTRRFFVTVPIPQ
jgi:general secretion pathway protein C